MFFERKRSEPHPAVQPRWPEPVSLEALKAIFEGCDDFENHCVYAGGQKSCVVQVCYMDGLISGIDAADSVLTALGSPVHFPPDMSHQVLLDLLLSGAVGAATVKLRTALDDIVSDLNRGFVCVVFDELSCAISFECKSNQTRSINEPTLEKTVKGAKDAFVETLRVNTSLVRRRLRTPDLKVSQLTLGRKSSTSVALLYVQGVASDKTVSQLRSRLDAIDVDGFLSTGNLEQYITDNPSSPFPQLLHTERPDKFAMDLLDGRVGIIVDGLPLGFLLPARLADFMRVGEDRGWHFVVSTALKLMRWAALALTLLLPAAYAAIAMYHQEMLPLKMLESTISAKQEVPFSTGVEILSMLVAFELLQEAGLRLPNPVGETVSIIGALIVGQSAVDAKVISPVAVIIVATVGICGFIQPSQDFGAALRIARFALVLLAVALGMLGIMLGLALLVWYLARMDSFGVCYLSPFSEGGARSVLNALIQPPLPKNKLRPPEICGEDKRNQI
ncbi:MAG: spore germination protein [Oscillospiraceae bacterium]|nr:spore germination protein [Oscillospiraceae bacterium]